MPDIIGATKKINQATYYNQDDIYKRIPTTEIDSTDSIPIPLTPTAPQKEEDTQETTTLSQPWTTTVREKPPSYQKATNPPSFQKDANPPSYQQATKATTSYQEDAKSKIAQLNNEKSKLERKVKSLGT